MWIALLLDLADLLRALGSDDIETRDRASEAIYRSGWSRELDDARRAAVDPEVRNRLGDLLARLRLDARIRGFGGGNRVDGLAMALRAETWHGRGPFRLRVEVMNVGSSTRTFPGLGRWDVELPDEDARNETDARVVVRKVFGQSLRRARWGRAEGHPARPVELRPGESVACSYELKDIPAGDYEVRVDAASLRSNPVRLSVR